MPLHCSPILFRVLFGLALAVVGSGMLPAAAQDPVPAAPQPQPRVPNADPWFGAVNAITAPQLALDAGVKWQRIIFPWEEIQPEGPGQFRQGYFSDVQIDAQRAAGIEVVGVTLYTPAWAARDPRFGARSVPRGLDRPIDDPQNVWAAYVRRLVSHYRGRVDTWVIYNEPDLFSGDDFRTFAGTPAEYAQLLKTGYLAAKSVNPDAKIMMAGLTYFWDKENNRPQYFQQVLEALARDPAVVQNNWYFDIADVHAYGNPLNSFTQPTVFRRLMRERGIDKPIWIDESNVSIKNDPRVQNGEGPFRATLDEQASYIIQSMALARAAGVARYSTYKMQDEFPENEDEYWGLTRNDGTVRPSYLAYQTAVRFFQGARSAVYTWEGGQLPPTEAEITTLLASNANRYQWPWPAAVNKVLLQRPTEQGTQRVTVIWNASPQPSQVVLPAQGTSAQLVDKYGRASILTPRDGGYLLSLEPSRNNSDPRDPTLYLVGGSPLIIVEDLPIPTPVPAE